MSREREAVKYRRYGLILYYILKILGKTLNIKMIKNDKVKENEESYVFAFWHNKLVIPTICFSYIEKKAVLASPSKDGELISVPLEKMGFHMVRGSSNQNPTASLVSLIKLMKKGYSIGTPVDGPKGPIYEVKPGMIYLAQKGSMRMVPLGGAYKSKWTFNKAWDKFQFPKPFTTMVFLMGDPIEIPKDANIEEYCEILKNKLNELDKEAEKYL